MTLDNPESGRDSVRDVARELAAQREVTRVGLAGLAGFALAGSGAIREHGMIDRPTEDVDLFTNNLDVTAFSHAVDQVTGQLQQSGFVVEQTRRAPQFARLHVATADGFQLDVDLGVDWRHEDPVRLELGPVLSVADAVGNKVSALYSRGEPRDFLDVDAIRASGRFTDAQLVTAAGERDPGFEVAMFATQLAGVRRLTLRDVRGYGVTADQLEDIKTRCTHWANTLRQQTAPGTYTGREATSSTHPALGSEELRGLIAHRQAGFPTPATGATRPQPGPAVEPARRPTDPDRGMER